ncbi:MAG: LysM peptidoglycan-binding domain-containing protein [Chlamydiota bacterium]
MTDQDSLHSLLARRSRRLTHALILSVTLNVAFLATFFYAVLRDQKVTHRLVQEKKDSLKCSLAPVSSKIADVFTLYLGASFEELIDLLEDETHVEQGQLACDLALACLVVRHHFDFERALSGSAIERREYAFQNPVNSEWVAVTLFAGLSFDQRIALRDFARREKWPLTAKGLFLALRKKGPKASLSLKRAFFLSSEFYVIQAALSRWLPGLACDELLAFLLQVDWPSIHLLAENLIEYPSQKKEQLALFLKDIFAQGQREAGMWLFALDADFALNRLDDAQLKLLLAMFDTSTPEVEAFLIEVTKSLRCDAVRKEAQSALKSLHEEKIDSQPFGAPEVEPMLPMKTYVVQFGDTLWKISRRFEVPVDILQTINGLHSDVLLPGSVLLIPQNQKGKKVMERGRHLQGDRGGI